MTSTCDVGGDNQWGDGSDWKLQWSFSMTKTEETKSVVGHHAKAMTSSVYGNCKAFGHDDRRDEPTMMCNKVLCNEDGCSGVTIVDDGAAAAEAEAVERMWELVWGCYEGLVLGSAIENSVMVKATDHDGELMMKAIDQDGSIPT
ncbi:hypothetical protein F0562_010175 [Nyssa sinensis]|uniref:Uncharacterized protein n=1 Tax=Nyssa sinensis TaxID=561372 RepID=A0A5J5A1U4_9ASTE|nr:hypothetical protein F0562_010175 [Nyssa sinensis]